MESRIDLQSVDTSDPLYENSMKTPIVQNLEFKREYISKGFGFGFNFGFDIAIGYNVLALYLFTNFNNLLFNPKIYLEASSHNYIEFKLYNFEFRFPFEILGYKYTVVDY